MGTGKNEIMDLAVRDLRGKIFSRHKTTGHIVAQTSLENPLYCNFYRRWQDAG